MGIDINSFALCLFQQQFQIIQIMTADNDKRPLFYRESYFRRLRMSESLCIGTIQQRHARKVHFTDCIESLIKEIVNGSVPVPQHYRMISIRRHAADTEQDQGTQGTDILRRVPEICHIIIIILAAGSLTGEAAGDQSLLLLLRPVNQLPDIRIVKIHIRQRCEKTFHNQRCRRIICFIFIALHSLRQTDQRACQLILKLCRIRSLPADSHSAGTTLTTCSLFTLITKHISFLLYCKETFEQSHLAVCQMHYSFCPLCFDYSKLLFSSAL